MDSKIRATFHNVRNIAAQKHCTVDYIKFTPWDFIRRLEVNCNYLVQHDKQHHRNAMHSR